MTEISTEDLAQEDHDDRTNGWPIKSSRAPEHHDENHHDGDVYQGKDDMRIDEGHIVHVEGSSEACEEGRDHEGDELVLGGVDPH